MTLPPSSMQTIWNSITDIFLFHKKHFMNYFDDLMKTYFTEQQIIVDEPLPSDNPTDNNPSTRSNNIIN